jgi:carboxyl-terminal processing protease
MKSLVLSSRKQGLKGLILDLRGNPGGLLESAVDVSALLVPQGSDIVSAKGRAFGEVSHAAYTICHIAHA